MLAKGGKISTVLAGILEAGIGVAATLEGANAFQVRIEVSVVPVKEG